MAREGRWSEAIASGKLNFVAKVKSELGLKASRSEVVEECGTYALSDESEAYVSNLSGKNEALSSKNTRLWKENPNLRRLSFVRLQELSRSRALDLFVALQGRPCPGIRAHSPGRTPVGEGEYRPDQ